MSATRNWIGCTTLPIYVPSFADVFQWKVINWKTGTLQPFVGCWNTMLTILLRVGSDKGISLDISGVPMLVKMSISTEPMCWKSDLQTVHISERYWLSNVVTLVVVVVLLNVDCLKMGYPMVSAGWKFKTSLPASHNGQFCGIPHFQTNLNVHHGENPYHNEERLKSTGCRC